MSEVPLHRHRVDAKWRGQSAQRDLTPLTDRESERARGREREDEPSSPCLPRERTLFVRTSNHEFAPVTTNSQASRGRQVEGRARVVRGDHQGRQPGAPS